MQHYHMPKLTQALINELEYALQMVKAYGSIEIYVQNSQVTQITVRNIKKTKVDLNGTKKKFSGKTGKMIKN